MNWLCPLLRNKSTIAFHFLLGAHERLPFINTTNLKFADWVQVFGDGGLTAALVDR